MSHRGPFSRWIFDEFAPSARSLGIARILFAATLLLMEFPRGLWIGTMPASFWIPPLGLGLFFAQPPPTIFFLALLLVNVTLTVALLVGYRTKPVGLALAAAMLLTNTFEYGFGKINHDILLVVALITMSFSGWGTELSRDAGRPGLKPGPVQGWPLALFALIIAFAMFTAAIPKARSGWLDPSLNCTQGHVIFNYYASVRPTALGRFAMDTFPGWLWKSMDWLTVLVEGAFVVAMFSRRALRSVCAWAVLFHVGVGFMMEIIFWENIIVYAVFFDWERALPAARRAPFVQKLNHWFDKIPLVAIPAAGVGLAQLYRVTRGPAGPTDAEPLGAILMIIAGFCATAYLLSSLRQWLFPVAPATGADDPAPGHAIILFDGFCGLCDRIITFVIRHDQKDVFRLASLQSDIGRRLVARHGLDPSDTSSIVLIQGGTAMRYSSAMLTIWSRLGLPWSLARLFILVPPPVRDTVYDFVSVRRYGWFGRTDTCRLPTPAEQRLFLPDGSSSP